MICNGFEILSLDSVVMEYYLIFENLKYWDWGGELIYRCWMEFWSLAERN